MIEPWQFGIWGFASALLLVDIIRWRIEDRKTLLQMYDRLDSRLERLEKNQ